MNCQQCQQATLTTPSSPFYPIIQQLEFAAGFAGNDAPETKWTGSKR